MEQGNRPIPNRLKMHRKQMRYKQHHVAALLGLQSAVPLSLWEKGTTLPNTHNLIKLSLIYRTYPNELYSELFNNLREELREKELELFKNA
ncbi:MAG: helix-turn-helix domain-containing protein [Mucilaginibacter sp.]